MLVNRARSCVWLSALNVPSGKVTSIIGIRHTRFLHCVLPGNGNASFNRCSLIKTRAITDCDRPYGRREALLLPLFIAVKDGKWTRGQQLFHCAHEGSRCSIVGVTSIECRD